MMDVWAAIAVTWAFTLNLFFHFYFALMKSWIRWYSTGTSLIAVVLVFFRFTSSSLSQVPCVGIFACKLTRAKCVFWPSLKQIISTEKWILIWKLIRYCGEKITSARTHTPSCTQLMNYVRVVWLTNQMETK